MAVAAMTLFLALAAAWTFLRIAVRVAFAHYGLTDRQVLVGSFLRVRGATFEQVQDVEVVRGLLGRLLGYGDVLVRTASTSGLLRLRAVPAPHEWFREIHESTRVQQQRYESAG